MGWGGRGELAVTKKDVRKELNFLKEGMRNVCNLFSAFRGSSAEQNEKRNESRVKIACVLKLERVIDQTNRFLEWSKGCSSKEISSGNKIKKGGRGEEVEEFEAHRACNKSSLQQRAIFRAP